MKSGAIIAMSVLLAGCASSRVEPAALGPPVTDSYTEPNEVKSDQLQYGEEPPDAYAPVLTARTGYPTQRQAFHALQRSKKYPAVTNVRLFACAPGYVDEITGRTEQIDAPVVHCATDLFNGKGRKIERVPLNYYYREDKWQLQDPETAFKRPLWREPTTRLRQVRRKEKY
jgi:hypothetical protein